MSKLTLIAMCCFLLSSCSSDSEKSIKKVPVNAVADTQKLKLSSCISCSGGGSGGRPEVCMTRERCVVSVMSIGAAIYTVAQCKKTFLDENNEEHNYACREKK